MVKKADFKNKLGPLKWLAVLIVAALFFSFSLTFSSAKNPPPYKFATYIEAPTIGGSVPAPLDPIDETNDSSEKNKKFENDVQDFFVDLLIILPEPLFTDISFLAHSRRLPSGYDRGLKRPPKFSFI